MIQQIQWNVAKISVLIRMKYLTRRIAKIGFVAKMVELTKEYVHWMNVGKRYVTSNCN